MRKLLREMTKELGLGDTLRLDDFGRIYFPNALAQDREMKSLQREAAMKQLLGQQEDQIEDSNITESIWPPKPNNLDTKQI
ncbi:hypothetical protein DM450_03995 [Sphingomonas sp. IC081]|nr:hypothetical protein DM450_03995 [Sphingomonas sp. IC081]